MENCLEYYNGEIGRRLIEQVNKYSEKDKNSHSLSIRLQLTIQ